MKLLNKLIVYNVLVGIFGHTIAYTRYPASPLSSSPAASDPGFLSLVLAFLIALALVGIILSAETRLSGNVVRFLYLFQKDRTRLSEFSPEQRVKVGVEAVSLPYIIFLAAVTVGIAISAFIHIYIYVLGHQSDFSFPSQFRIIFDYIFITMITSFIIYFLTSLFVRPILDQIAAAGFPLPDHHHPGLIRISLQTKMGISFLFVVVFILYLTSADISGILQTLDLDPLPSSELVHSLQNRIIANNVILGIFTALLILFVIRSLTVPLFRLTRGAEKISSGSLDPNPELLPVSGDELGTLSYSIDQMRQSLSRQLAQLRSQSRELENIFSTIQETVPLMIETTTEMADASQRLQTSSARQFESFASVQSGIEELSQVVEKISESAEVIVDQTGAAHQAGAEISRTIGDSRKRIEHLAYGAGEMEERVQAFAPLSQDVERILLVIEGIANRSDILALNATLQGAKAGQAGAGLILIADRMRDLAEIVTREADRVRPLLGQIEASANKALQLINNNMDETRIGSQLAVRADESFQEIYQLAEITNQAVSEISHSTEQQRTIAAEMVKDVQEAAGIARTGSDLSAKSAQTARRLTQISEQLRSILGTDA